MPCLFLRRGGSKDRLPGSRGCSPAQQKRKDGKSHANAAMDIPDSLEWPDPDGCVGSRAGRSPAWW